MNIRNIFILLTMVGLVIFIVLFQSIYYPISFIIEANYLSQPYDKKGFIKGGLFLISYFTSIIAIMSIFIISNRWIAFILIGVCAILFGIDAYVQFLGSSPNGITVALLSTAFNETGRIANLLVYKTPLVYAVSVVLVFVILAIFTRKLIYNYYQIRFWWSILFLAVVIIGIGILNYKIFSIKSQSYPAPIKALLVLREYLMENNSDIKRALGENIKTTKKNEYETIVWIIDESISGKYLSINDYAIDTTPFLNSIKSDFNVRNYGTVASISNCSNSSNLLLRIGLTSTLQQEFSFAKKTLPTIFQYAKRAGFETYLIDAQVTPGEVQNHLTSNDLSFIDQLISYDRSILPRNRDNELLKTLNTLLEPKPITKRFVVAVRWGAHWPYPLAYPQEQSRFNPAATETLTEMALENKTIITNAYLNAVHYSVDVFLQGLLANKTLDNQLIFYTSDHGQSL